MGKGNPEPVIPGVSDIPAWKVRSGPGPGLLERDYTQAFDWEPDITLDADEEEIAEAEQEVSDSLFAEEEFQQWTTRQAILWICNGSNAFEVLGFRAKPLDCSGSSPVRKRYKRLSLLTHPDKTQDPDAGPAFQKLSHAMKILADEEKQRHLLRVLFPHDYGGMSEGERRIAEVSGVGVYESAAKAQAQEEQQQHDDLESQLKAALKEKEQLQEEDKEATDRFKKRGSLASLAPSATTFSMGDAGEAKRLRRAMAAASQPPGKNQWGLPEAFMAPAAPSAPAQGSASKGDGAAKSEEADPNLLWQLTGAVGLAANGWQRLESRSQPGLFYFLHAKSGKRVLPTPSAPSAKPSSAPPPLPPLPPGWERRESRSKPGVFYYANAATGETSMEPPSASPGAVPKARGGAPAPAVPRLVAWPAGSGATEGLAQPGLAAPGSQAWLQSGQEQFQQQLQQQQQEFQQQLQQQLQQQQQQQQQQQGLQQREAAKAGREQWPWERAPDPPPGGWPELAPEKETGPRVNHGSDLWPLVQEFIRNSGLDEEAAEALMAAPFQVQRRVIEGPPLASFGNPSAVLIAHLDLVMSGRRGGAAG